MKIYNDPQGSQAWLSVRLGKLTASNAQAIKTNGKGLDTLVLNAVAERLTGKQTNTYTNPDMERGNEIEDDARFSYQLETGLLVEQVGFCELDEYIGASPDGFVDDGLVEIKCPTPKVFVEYMYTGKVDPKYYAQMQMQMLVTARKWCDYVVYHPDFPQTTIIKRIDEDADFQEKLNDGLERGVKKIQEVLHEIENKQAK